jgi:hypothetical protein
MPEGIWQDLKHGVRMLVKNPGFSVVAVVSLAIGIGVNAATFSMADALILRPLQVPRASELVAVSATTPQQGADGFRNRSLSYRDYVDLRDRARSFAGLAAYRILVTSFANLRDEPVQSRLGLAVSGNFFDTLGLQPALGRFFRFDGTASPDAPRLWCWHTRRGPSSSAPTPGFSSDAFVSAARSSVSSASRPPASEG